MTGLDNHRIVVYGAGEAGRHAIDYLLVSGFEVPLCLDRQKAGQSYRGIPILPRAPQFITLKG